MPLLLCCISLISFFRVAISIDAQSPVRGCCKNDTIRVGLWQATEKPWYEFDANETPAFRGYFPSLLDELAKDMGFALEFVQLSYEDSTNLNELLQMGRMDTFFYPFEAADELAYSIPIATIKFVALVHKSTKKKDMWALFGPFSAELWIAMLSCIIGLTGILVLLRLLDPAHKGRLVQEVSPEQIAKASYHIWAAVLGGEDYEWLNWPGRIFRLGLLFTVLIVVATYTANLAAFFTAPSFVVHGPKDMSEFRQAKVCCLSSSYAQAVQPYVGTVTNPNTDISSFSEVAEVEARVVKFCLDGLRDGRFDALVDADYYVHRLALDNCEEFAEVPGISFLPVFLGLFFLDDPEGRLRAKQISLSYSFYVSTPAFHHLQQDYMAFGDSCKRPEADETDVVELDSMYGLGIIVGGLALCSVIAAVVEHLMASRGRTESKAASAMTDGEMLRVLLGEVASLKAGIQSAQSDTYGWKSVIQAALTFSDMERSYSTSSPEARLPPEECDGNALWPVKI